MIKQREMRTYMRMEAIAKKFETYRGEMIMRLKSEEPQESGRWRLRMLITDHVSTAYAMILKQIKRLHPELVSSITKWKEEFTKTTDAHHVAVTLDV